MKDNSKRTHKGKRKYTGQGASTPDEFNSTERTQGSLVVVGTGIKTVGQLSVEAIAFMQNADALLYLVGDPIGESVIQMLSPNGAESLADCYKEGEERIHAYNAMVDRILNAVRSGKRTVAAFYGHPGVFAFPSHESIRKARSEGFSAQMLPAISSEDCLFADLGVDPGDGGCQSYEATDFLLNSIVIETSSQLILWQVGSLGDWTFKQGKYDTRAMPLLVQKLLELYPWSHPVTLYSAVVLPGTNPMVMRIPLYALSNFPVTSGMTLYVPPARRRVANVAMQSQFTRLTQR